MEKKLKSGKKVKMSFFQKLVSNRLTLILKIFHFLALFNQKVQKAKMEQILGNNQNTPVDATHL